MGIEGKELRQKWRRGGEETGAMAWNHIYKLRQKQKIKNVRVRWTDVNRMNPVENSIYVQCYGA